MQLKDKEKHQADHTQDPFPPAPMIPAEKLPDWLYVDDLRKKKKRGEANPRLLIFLFTILIAFLPVVIGFILAITTATTVSTRGGEVRDLFDELPANIPDDAKFQSELNIDFQRRTVTQDEWHYWTYSGETGTLIVYVNSSNEDFIPMAGLYSETGQKLMSGYGSSSSNSRTSQEQVHRYPVESGKIYKILVGNLGGIEGTYNIRIERKS